MAFFELLIWFWIAVVLAFGTLGRRGNVCDQSKASTVDSRIKMIKVDLGQTINTVANIGVIAGIVFLAMELQQNNELMAVEARATALSMTTEIWSSAIEDADLGAIAIKDRRGETLTDEEELRLNALWTRSLYSAEYVFRDAPDMLRQQSVVWKRAHSAYGSLRRTWSGDSTGSALDGRDMFSPDFADYMNANVFTP